MAISSFPAAGGDSAATNDFILDKNDTTNTTFSPGRSFAAGGYSVVVTGSTAYDIYLLDSTGSAVGYTNGTSILASAAFEEVVALGLGTADTVAFTYGGPSTNATSAGDETGAGAYLTSITPSDLGQIDDTATVVGGNFASGLELAFISGTVVKSAKNVVVGSDTSAVVTRPDDLIEDEAPYDLRAINPGVTPPTGSNAHILSGTVTAGTDPSFVTTSPILGFAAGVAGSATIETSDSEGSVVNWQVTAGTLPSGVELGTATGILAGTPAANGYFYATIQITDDGGNTNSQEFEIPVGPVLNGQNGTVIGGTSYAWFTSSDDLVIENVVGTANIEFIAIAGGGGGGDTTDIGRAGGGGGAGGLFFGTAEVTSNGTVAVTVGAGGANDTDGNDSVLPLTNAGTAFAGGAGGEGIGTSGLRNGHPGGSGGGGAGNFGNGGAGTAGQGFAGARPAVNNNSHSGGGGGAGGTPSTGSGFEDGGDGADYGAWASAVGIIYDAGYFAGGGAGIYGGFTLGVGGLGGGGNGGSGAGSVNSGGGGGGNWSSGSTPNGGAGGSGLVIVRFG